MHYPLSPSFVLWCLLSVPVWCSSICFMAQANTQLCFHGEIKVVGSPVSAAQSPSLLPQTPISTVSSFSSSFHSCYITERSPLWHAISAFILYDSLFPSLSFSSTHQSSSPPLFSCSQAPAHPVPLSLSPLYSAVKASSLVFQKIKTLPHSLPLSSIPLSLSPSAFHLHPALSIALWMPKRNATLNVFLAEEQQRGQQTCVLAPVDRHMWLSPPPSHLTRNSGFYLFFVGFSAHANQRAMLERLQSALKTVKDSKRNYSLHFSFHVYLEKWEGIWCSVKLCARARGFLFCVVH